MKLQLEKAVARNPRDLNFRYDGTVDTARGQLAPSNTFKKAPTIILLLDGN